MKKTYPQRLANFLESGIHCLQKIPAVTITLLLVLCSSGCGGLSNRNNTTTPISSLYDFTQQYAQQTLWFDNNAFIERAHRSYTKNTTTLHRYVDVESSMVQLRTLHGIRNKKTVRACINYFQIVFYQQLLKDPFLTAHLQEKYRDAEAIRFHFTANNRADLAKIQTKVNRIYRHSVQLFVQRVDQFKALWMDFYAMHQPTIPASAPWFLAGIGNNPIQANLAARIPSTFLTHDQRVYPFTEVIPYINSTLQRIFQRQKQLQHSFISKQHGLLYLHHKRAILQQALITLLNKTSNPKRLNKKIHQQYRLQLPSNTLHLMQQYSSAMHTIRINPELMTEKPSNIPLQQAVHGLVSIHFSGMYAKNLQAQMIALAKIENKPPYTTQQLQTVFDKMRAAINRIAINTQSKKALFVHLVRKIDHSQKIVYFSGNKGFFFPKKSWTETQKQRLILALSNYHPNAYRVVFVPPFYKNKQPIPPSQLPVQIRRAENLNQLIRSCTMNTSIHPISLAQSKAIIIAVDFWPSQNKRNKFHVITAGKITPPHLDCIHRCALQAIILDKRMQLAKIAFIHPKD